MVDIICQLRCRFLDLFVGFFLSARELQLQVQAIHQAPASGALGVGPVLQALLHTDPGHPPQKKTTQRNKTKKKQQRRRASCLASQTDQRQKKREKYVPIVWFLKMPGASSYLHGTRRNHDVESSRQPYLVPYWKHSIFEVVPPLKCMAKYGFVP